VVITIQPDEQPADAPKPPADAPKPPT
jgi:hypothetical protein